MFYTYHQNNSRGDFIINDNVDYNVIIEADSAEEANDKAEEIGLYFDGVASGIDCGCCGDRWSQQYGGDRGDRYPSLYGKPLGKCKSRDSWRESLIVHYKNGAKAVYCMNKKSEKYRKILVAGGKAIPKKTRKSGAK